MAASSMPGSLVWNPDHCTGFIATPILPSSNATRVCGMMTQDDSVLGSCCSSVKTYTCWKYCATDTSYQNFASCVQKQSPSNSSANVFCQSATNSTIRQEEKSSAAPRASRTSTSTLLLVVCLFAFFMAPTSAEIVHSLNTIARRADSSTCQYHEDHHYVQLGRTTKVSNTFSQSNSGPGQYSMPIDSGIANNNRTINGRSAADEEYDAFFDILSDQFGRSFPAMSSIETLYEFTENSSDFFVGFTPFQWCTNGTTTGCTGVLGESNGTMPVVACGPVFVSDRNSSSSNPAEFDKGAMIQGTLGTVVTN